MPSLGAVQFINMPSACALTLPLKTKWMIAVRCWSLGVQNYQSKFKLDFGNELARVKLIFISRTEYHEHCIAHTHMSNADPEPKSPLMRIKWIVQKAYRIRACATH